MGQVNEWCGKRWAGGEEGRERGLRRNMIGKGRDRKGKREGEVVERGGWGEKEGREGEGGI